MGGSLPALPLFSSPLDAGVALPLSSDIKAILSFFVVRVCGFRMRIKEVPVDKREAGTGWIGSCELEQRCYPGENQCVALVTVGLCCVFLISR